MSLKQLILKQKCYIKKLNCDLDYYYVYDYNTKAIFVVEWKLSTILCLDQGLLKE